MRGFLGGFLAPELLGEQAATHLQDALDTAIANPDKQVVFFAVGFETTAPSTAVTVLKAMQKGITNFSLFCNHVTIVPPLKAILESPDLRLNGFRVIATRPDIQQTLRDSADLCFLLILPIEPTLLSSGLFAETMHASVIP